MSSPLEWEIQRFNAWAYLVATREQLDRALRDLARHGAPQGEMKQAIAADAFEKRFK